MEQNQMGVAFVPLTFPTSTMLGLLRAADPHEVATRWTRQKVNDMYNWYKEGISKGISPYTSENTEIANYISEHTSFSANESQQFAWTLWKGVLNGKIASKYYVAETPQTSLIEMPIGVNKFVYTYLNTLKWVSIAGIIGVGLYFSWPLLVTGRKKLSKRMA